MCHGSTFSGWQQNKNVTLKVNSHCFILHRSYSISFNLSNVGEIFWSCIRKLRKRKRKFCVVFTYSRKKAHEIRKFFVTVVQRLLWNLQECDARAALLFCYYFFTGSNCCLRPRRWFSSLMLWSRNSATMVMWRHTSSLYRFNFKETGLIFRTSCLMGINNFEVFSTVSIVCKNWPTPATCSPKMLWSHGW